MIAFAILFFISVWTYNWGGRIDVWWSTWSISLIFAALVLAHKIYKKYHWSAALAFIGVSVPSIYAFTFYDNHHAAWKPIVTTAIRLFSCYATFCLVMFVLVAMFTQKHHKQLFKSYAILCFINSVYVIIQWISGNGYLDRGGFWQNGTNNASLIAFTLPLLFTLPIKNKYKIPVIGIPIISIFCTLTSVPVGVLFLAIGTYLFFRLKRYKIVSLIALAIVIFSIGYFLDEKHFFSSSLRFGLYKITWNEFWQNGHLLHGEGLGTFHIFGPFFQERYNHDVPHWNIFLHNDFLQTLFEVGIIGFLACINMLIFAIYKFIRRKEYLMLSCLIAWVGCALFNFPLHYPMHAFFGLLLICEAFNEKLHSNDYGRSSTLPTSGLWV